MTINAVLIRALRIAPSDIEVLPIEGAQRLEERSWLMPEHPRIWSGRGVTFEFDDGTPPELREILTADRASAFLWLQTGLNVEGAFYVGDAEIPVSGTVVSDAADSRGILFSAAGSIGGRQVAVSFTATVAGRLLSGRFAIALWPHGPVGSGAFQCPDIMLQQREEPLQQRGDPGCGERIWGPKVVDEETDDPNVKAHYRITIYERCMTVEALDDKGKAIPGTEEKLEKTNEDPAGGGRTIIGYGGDSKGMLIRPKDPNKPDFKSYGHWIFLMVKGCNDKLTFFQFTREASRLSGEDPKNGTWKADPEDGSAYPATLEKGGKFSGGLMDCPGAQGTVPGVAAIWPKEKTIKDPNGGPDKKEKLKEADTYQLSRSFETYVCCGGTLLGYYTWDTMDVVTYHEKSGWSEPVTSNGGNPTFHAPPAKGENQDKVKCPS